MNIAQSVEPVHEDAIQMQYLWIKEKIIKNVLIF